MKIIKILIILLIDDNKNCNNTREFFMKKIELINICKLNKKPYSNKNKSNLVDIILSLNNLKI